jgi:hypothetical protein
MAVHRQVLLQSSIEGKMRRFSGGNAEQRVHEGGLGIALGAEPEVNGLALAVDRPVQVDPAALDLDIGLVKSPRAVGRAQAGPQPLLQVRRMGLDPAADGRVIDRYASVPQI